MEKKKIYKVGITYYNKKKGIHGLYIGRPAHKSWGPKYSTYCVIEDMSPDKNWWERKTVYRGSLGDCRQYLYDRFKGKK